MWIRLFSRVFVLNKYSSSRFLSTSAVPREEKIKVGNYDINYVKVGSGPHTLLCLPGALGTIWTDFKYQVQNFDRHKFTLLAWDAPGYGKSRPPEKEYCINFYERDADYIYYFMKALKIETYSLLGWSAGGTAAVIHAAKYPDVMQKLVIWGTCSFIRSQEIELFKKMTNMTNWSKETLQPMMDYYGKEFENHFLKWSNAMHEIYDKKNGNLFLECLPNIKCPTLILHGRKDPLVDKFHASYLNTYIAGSRIHVYSDGKHNIHIKYAEDFNKRVQEFLLN